MSAAVREPRVRFDIGDARRLPGAAARYDAVVSALVLNFIPDMVAGMADMARVVRPGGIVAGYVWDYAGKMELMRYFWDAAVALRPDDMERDEVARARLRERIRAQLPIAADGSIAIIARAWAVRGTR